MHRFITHVLAATLVASLLLLPVRVLQVRRRQRNRPIGPRPLVRIRAYQSALLTSAYCGAFVPLILWASDDLSAADIGWRAPSGEGWGYGFAAYVLFLLVLRTFIARFKLRRGRLRRRASTRALLPRDRRERRLAVAVSVAAGISEEAVFRGLLIAVGSEVYHLPWLVAAAASLALFSLAHAYQGARGMIGAATMGAVYTAIFLFSGSIVLGAIVHAAQDLLALLAIPERLPAKTKAVPVPPDGYRPPSPEEKPAVRSPIPDAITD